MPLFWESFLPSARETRASQRPKVRHGGCYDHIPPPTTIAPDQAFIEKGKPGYSGFGFDHLGVRVPAVVISPFTRAGKILNDVYDHTSILKT
jgi:phospholipase C